MTSAAGAISPVWSSDGRDFWYVAERAQGGKEFVHVGCTPGPAAYKRGLAFDHAVLAQALAAAGTLISLSSPSL